ncbi:MAG: hypothetical protein ABI343_13370 [Burkholderiaceae bacterium]
MIEMAAKLCQQAFVGEEFVQIIGGRGSRGAESNRRRNKQKRKGQGSSCRTHRAKIAIGQQRVNKKAVKLLGSQAWAGFSYVLRNTRANAHGATL